MEVDDAGAPIVPVPGSGFLEAHQGGGYPPGGRSSGVAVY